MSTRRSRPPPKRKPGSDRPGAGLEDAIRQQQQLQAEREAKLTSQLADRSDLNILGGSQDLGVLETARAEAGSPFDGNDPHSTWSTLHDTWFSPEATPSIASGTSPVPTGDAAVTPTLRPVDCMGKLCAFPPSAVRVPIVKTAPTGVGSHPPVTGASTRTAGVTAEWQQVGPRVIWSARRDWADAMTTARQTEIAASVLMSGSVAWAEQALPGMQQQIARDGRDLYQRVMEEMIAETFGVLSDAATGHWESALARSDTIGDRVRESILPEFKLARLILDGDGREAGDAAGDQFLEHATEVAKDRGKEVLDLLRGPAWVKEGAGYSVDMVDHWLQYLRTK